MACMEFLQIRGRSPKTCRLADESFLTGAYAVVVTKQGWRSSPFSAPPEKGRGMTRRRTLYLPALIVAVLMACAVAVLAVSEKAEATFAGKNGKIAYENHRVIYTVKPDGGVRPKSRTATNLPTLQTARGQPTRQVTGSTPSK